MKQNGQYYTSNPDSANLLNDFFQSETLLHDVNRDLSPLPTDITADLDTVVANEDGIVNVHRSLKIGKATGPDVVNNIILKELSVELSCPLCSFFNAPLSSDIVPQQWK